MSGDLENFDDDDIPADAFTGEAPKRDAKPAESKPAGPHPTGPVCPSCKKDEQGRDVRTWENKTKNGKPYFRCSACRGCWWPMRDEPKKIAVDSKWPPLPAKS